jgi:hypothetical protein
MIQNRGSLLLYVGEAENIRDRVKAHLEKDFWNQIVYFISKDENLTKAHIRYLEGKLIEQARQANRALVTNGQSSGAKLLLESCARLSEGRYTPNGCCAFSCRRYRNDYC